MVKNEKKGQDKLTLLVFIINFLHCPVKKWASFFNYLFLIIFYTVFAYVFN